MQTLNLTEDHFSSFNAFRVFDAIPVESQKRGHVLLEQLQTTLDIQPLLQKFAMEAGKYVDFSGLNFKNEQLDITLRGSRSGKTEQVFSLAVNGEVLGTLVYSMNRTLTRASRQLLKELHYFLVHPLNNAIKYHQALQLARQDGLTQLGNRRYFDEQLKRAMNQATRHNKQLGLIVCDLNKFKAVNDNYGHPVGDKVLIHFAQALRESVRDSDSVFRFGGDEFALIIEHANHESLDAILSRIQHAVAKNRLLKKYNVSSSLGATFMKNGDTEQSFYHRADQNLYLKKTTTPCKLSVV